MSGGKTAELRGDEVLLRFSERRSAYRGNEVLLRFGPRPPPLIPIVFAGSRRARALGDTIPLRTTLDWGKPDADVIPLCFGDLTTVKIPCIRYDSAGYKWAVADGIVTISAVYIEGTRIEGWESAYITDLSGHVVTLVVLSAPTDKTVSAAACGVQDDSGQAVNTPDRVITYLFKRVIKETAVQYDVSRLKRHPLMAGVKIAGLINDNTRTIRSWIDEIISAIGGIWDGYNLWSVYPGETPTVYTGSLSMEDMHHFKAYTRKDDTAGFVTIRYNHDPESDTFLGHVTRKAIGLPYGDTSIILESKWLRDANQADALCTRLLSRYAGLKVFCSFEINSHRTGLSLNPGDWLKIQHPFLPVKTPLDFIVLGVTPSESGLHTIEGETIWFYHRKTELVSFA